MRQIDFFDQGVARTGDASALVGTDGRTFSYREAQIWTYRIAHTLLAAV